MVWGPAKTPEPPARTCPIFWLLLSLPGEPAASQIHTYSTMLALRQGVWGHSVKGLTRW